MRSALRVAGLLAATLLCLAPLSAQEVGDRVVAVGAVEMRIPDKVVERLSAGDVVVIDRVQGEWLWVKSEAGNFGWVTTDDVRPAPGDVPPPEAPDDETPAVTVEESPIEEEPMEEPAVEEPVAGPVVEEPVEEPTVEEPAVDEMPSEETPEEEGAAQTAGKEDAYLQAIGRLATINVYITYVNIGSLADAYVKGVYTADQIQALMNEVVVLSDRQIESLQKIAEGGLSAGDQEFVKTVIEVHGLLKKQAGGLNTFAKSKNPADMQVYADSRQKVWPKIAGLLGIQQGGPTAPAGGSEGSARAKPAPKSR